MDNAGDDPKPTKQTPAAEGDAPASDQAELDRDSYAVRFEAVVGWPLHDALEQLGTRLDLGPGELLAELTNIAAWCAEQYESGRVIAGCGPFSGWPLQCLQLSERFTRELAPAWKTLAADSRTDAGTRVAGRLRVPLPSSFAAASPVERAQREHDR